MGSHGLGLKFNQKVVDYSHNICVTVAPAYLRGRLLFQGDINDEIFPLVICKIPFSTMNISQLG